MSSRVVLVEGSRYSTVSIPLIVRSACLAAHDRTNLAASLVKYTFVNAALLEFRRQLRAAGVSL